MMKILLILIVVLTSIFIPFKTESYKESMHYIEMMVVNPRTGRVTQHYINIRLPPVTVENSYSEPDYDDVFKMRRTVYVKDERCIPNPKNPVTASGYELKEGVCAINVVWDSDRNKWVYNSPLRMGDKIYIEGYGKFVVRDTGIFNPNDPKNSYWTVDLFMDITYEEAKDMGVELVDVYVLRGEEQ